MILFKNCTIITAMIFIRSDVNEYQKIYIRNSMRGNAPMLPDRLFGKSNQ